MNKKAVKAIITILVVAGAVTYLAASSFEETMIYYKTVEEALHARSQFETTPVRVNGLLVPGSIKQKPGTDNFIFELKKNDTVLQIKYAGILPDTMTEGKELIVQGTLVPGEDTLQATEILTKCPSKYEKEAESRNK
ncbi:MAG: cytochrome c maturation protein CcmE [Deltaproteobacteria bacterium]|nr:cytochrome c maturation protein CcmE [Deltaproteobacteria bacterium]MBN2671698.1 cytochrome c maturation protein CcmE [Deltaproteobacteria bacterium]